MLPTLAQRSTEDYNPSLRADKGKLVLQSATSVFWGHEQVQMEPLKPCTATQHSDRPAVLVISDLPAAFPQKPTPVTEAASQPASGRELLRYSQNVSDTCTYQRWD